MKLNSIYLIGVLLCLGQPGVAAEKYSAPPPEFFKSTAGGRAVTVSAGDILNVRFYFNPELNKTVRVRDDGKISLDLFQGIPAAGLTPEELQKNLVELYSKEFTKPEITVDIESQANSSAFVTGEVLLPGAKEVRGKMTVAMLLAMSQVNQKTAGTKSVFLIRGTAAAEYRVYKLDASSPSGAARGIEVIPGDVLFVPRKGIAKADDFMDQYVRQLLPGTVNGGASVLFTSGYPSVTTAAAGH